MVQPPFKTHPPLSERELPGDVSQPLFFSMYPGEASHTSVATSEGRAGIAGDMVNGHAIWDDIPVSYILYMCMENIWLTFMK